MKKVVFFLNSLDGGGTERVTLSLATGLVRRGYLVTLLLVSKKGELLDKADPRLVIHDFGKSRAFACLPGLRAYFQKERPDVVFTAMPTINIIGLFAKLIAGVNTAVIPVEHMPVSIDARENKCLEPKLAYFLYPLVYRAASRIVIVGEEAREDFLRTYPTIPPEKVRKIHNPVVTEELLASINAPPELAYFVRQPGDIPIIVGVGRLVRQKNFELLLQAFSAVRKEIPCRLVIMGTGQDRSKLDRLAKELGVIDDVLLPGFVRNPFACMARSDLFVLSPIYETLPTVLIEALACGLPVVATPCIGVGEILADGQYGTMLSSFELNELIREMLVALKRPAKREVLEARAREFSADRSVDEYIRLIDEVVTEGIG